jgi:hypothetical protein
VEYDVRDDLPDETSVFRLEPASEDLISKLILLRFDHVSQVDAGTIARFSGGNARIAISLANTVRQGETLSEFRDEQLFERLFKQRNESSKHLMLSAEVCSLVYSFEGTDVNSEKSELAILSSLIENSSLELYQDVAELEARDLVQSRSVWRAILPQAIANRLAQRALKTIPKDDIVSTFLDRGSERLFKSFTRRLNFLHDCPAAIDIANSGLVDDGWLGDIGNLSEFGMDVFQNIAPVSPIKALDAIERAANADSGSQFTSRDNPHYYRFVCLLRSLAYDRDIFQRSTRLICRFALAEDQDENTNPIRDVLQSLFSLYLSGTLALADDRLEIIEELVNTDCNDRQNLGLLLIDSALEAWHFTSFHGFDFGARLRDYGYVPRMHDEIVSWYQTFIEVCTRLALSNKPVAGEARKVLAQNFRGLWTKGRMYDDLEAAVQKIRNRYAWNEGWLAVRRTLRFDGDGFDADVRDRLRRLEELLRPTDIIERARIYALSNQHHVIDLNDEENASSGGSSAEEIACEIGTQVAQNPDALQTLLPELVSTQSTRIGRFGWGLAEGSSDKQALWLKLRDQLNNTEEEKRNISVLLGFFVSLSKNDPEFCKTILDGLVNDQLLGNWFLSFQTTIAIDQRGLERLHEALDVEMAPIETFSNLAWGRAHETISDDALAELLRKIAAKNDGIAVSIEILYMRFRRPNSDPAEYSEDLISTGRDLLSNYKFPDERRRDYNSDDYLSRITEKCLKGEVAAAAATSLTQNLADAIAENRISYFYYPRLLNSLSRLQPISFLNVFLGGNSIECYHRSRMFSNDFEMHENPLDAISDEVIISWCDEDPGHRYPVIAGTIQGFNESVDPDELEWKPVVYSILERAPDLNSVLEEIGSTIWPTSWSGSLSEILQRRSVLLRKLFQHDNIEITAWARKMHTVLQESITKEREREDSRGRERDERFE